MGLLNLHPWTFLRYTVREFEEKVIGAYLRHEHASDRLMRHALVTGQWSKRVTFRDLTGKDAPTPLDPRQADVEEEELTEDDLDRMARVQAMIAEATIRAMGQQGPTIEE